jgi:hypothetical protein
MFGAIENNSRAVIAIGRIIRKGCSIAIEGDGIYSRSAAYSGYGYLFGIGPAVGHYIEDDRTADTALNKIHGIVVRLEIYSTRWLRAVDGKGACHQWRRDHLHSGGGVFKITGGTGKNGPVPGGYALTGCII